MNGRATAQSAHNTTVKNCEINAALLCCRKRPSSICFCGMPAISQLSIAALLLSCLGIYGVAAEYVQFQTNSDPLTQPNNTIAAAVAPSGEVAFSCLH